MKQIIRTYNKSFSGNLKRKSDEKKLARKGFYPVSEEEVSKYNVAGGIALAIVFLPLAILGNQKKIRVVYEKIEN